MASACRFCYQHITPEQEVRTLECGHKVHDTCLASRVKNLTGQRTPINIEAAISVQCCGQLYRDITPDSRTREEQPRYRTLEEEYGLAPLYVIMACYVALCIFCVWKAHPSNNP